jgi:peptidoglycan/LPS O-acetylase OafA/YrhL
MSASQQGALTVLSGSHDRLDNIEALRALAVLAVILYHYTARYTPQYLSFAQPVWPVTYGNMGVDLFFIISGYCIYMTATHCPGVALFWARRISRLQPAFMAAILITFLVVSSYGPPERMVSGLAALANVAWLHAIGLAPPVDGVYWSLVVELKLYLLFGVVFFGLKGRGDPVLWWTVLYLIGMGIRLVDHQLSGGMFTRSTYSFGTFVFPYSGFFLMGMLIYRWHSTAHWLKVLAVAAFAFTCWGIGQTWTEGVLFFALFPLSKVVLDWKKLWVPAPIVFVGFISYPLYLVHNNVGVVVIRETAWDVPWEYARIMLAIAASLLIATVVSLTVEHRFRKVLERPIERFLAFILSLPSRFRPAPAQPAAEAAEVVRPRTDTL